MPFLATKHVEIPTKDILTWLIDDSRCDPEQPIYIDAANPSRSYNLRQARTAIRKLCAGFKAVGLQKGDVVCLVSFNDVRPPLIDFPIAVNGIVAFGGIFAGTNPAYTQYEIAHAIKTAKVKAFIAEPDLLTNVLPAAKAAGIPASRIFVFDRPSQAVPAGLQSWTALMQHGEADWLRFDDLHTARTTEAARLFSSGTTGLPKAARLSHHNFVAQQHCVENPSPPPFAVRTLIAAPLFHAGMVPRTHFAPLRTGTAVYILRRFDPELFLRYVERYQINTLSAIPPMAIALLSAPEERRRALKCVRMAGSGGRPVPNVDMKLVDESGLDISGYDVHGEIWVRGPILFMGYVDNPQANAAWDSDGYFPTGDIGYCSSKNKQWYIVDRKKEMIKVRGFQVAPPELEGILLSHPQIVDAGVIGVKFAKDGSEFPRAYVVKREGSEGAALTEGDVKKHVAERLSSYKRLEGGVVFVDELPRNPAGKILKQPLRDRAAKELGAKL
ncbi:hypothetical protein SLS57_011730 [Botryosphaeria dothidea]